MDEVLFNSSSCRSTFLPLFLRWTSSAKCTPYRAPSSIYRRGCILHQHFHLQFLYILRLGKSYSMRRRPKVPMNTAHTHYKTILFYEAHAAHVERTTLITPSKLNSGGVESRSRSRSSSFLQTAGLWTRFFSMMLSTSACVGTYEDSDGHPQSTLKQHTVLGILLWLTRCEKFNIRCNYLSYWMAICERRP